MRKKVMYFGDTSQPGPASYLIGIMEYFNIPYMYTPSEQPAPEEAFSDSAGLYVLSDYRSKDFTDEQMKALCNRVEDGTGLLMLGGWESYHGLGGDYDETPLSDLLPVNIYNVDDRRNVSQLALVRKNSDHPILDGLPFDTPPGVGGYNEFLPKDGTKVLLEGEIYHVNVDKTCACFEPVKRFPLLVVDDRKGRRACLATDVAPHWVGGFVDWGNSRLTSEFNDDAIEVGNWYAQFFHQLLLWCLGR